MDLGIAEDFQRRIMQEQSIESVNAQSTKRVIDCSIETLLGEILVRCALS